LKSSYLQLVPALSTNYRPTQPFGVDKWVVDDCKAWLVRFVPVRRAIPGFSFNPKRSQRSAMVPRKHRKQKQSGYATYFAVSRQAYRLQNQ